MEYQFNTIEEALEDLRAGKIILATDDPDRENEGDMICAAEFATQENINFYGVSCKGADLHTNEQKGCREVRSAADGFGKYR